MTALSTRQAAELAGLTPEAFRRAMLRERQAGRPDLRLPAADWPDARTPLWDGSGVRAWAERRPGPGRWGR